ncbi:MAG: hypothetical protein GTN36_01715 [Candidatus Aenigmarchaeota archaeon]|nr:hypothetical protein [Candidatus Aenigmarchaeota archaeon]
MPKPTQQSIFDEIAPLSEHRAIDLPYFLQATGIIAGGATAEGLIHEKNRNYSEWARKVGEDRWKPKTEGAPSSYADLLKTMILLKEMGYGEKPIRKRVRRKVKIPNALYESLKHVKSDGANAEVEEEIEEIEFAGHGCD